MPIQLVKPRGVRFKNEAALFVIDGEASRISTITKDFHTNKKMDTIKLITI